MTILTFGALAGLLKNPDFLRIWLIGVCTGVSRWLEMLVVGVYAFEVTGSPFLVALLVMIRLVPLVMFGAVIGTLADRNSPRAFLLVGLVLGSIASGSVFGLLSYGVEDYWVVVVSSIASGVVWTNDLPVRRRMMGDIAGTDRLVSAIGLDSATNNATRMLGPLMGGLLYQWFGAAGAFAVTSCLHVVAVVMILQLRVGLSAGPRSEPPAKIAYELREGFNFAINDHDVFRILLVTIAFNVFGLPFLAMIPVIGSEQLHLNAGWIGGIAALEGAGAFLGALTIAVRPPPFSYRRIFFFSALVYVAFTFLAGWMVHAWAMAVVLFCVGLAVAGFGALQSTLIYSTAPPHMRSRLFGVLVICIGTGLIGVFNMGVMGEWYGGATAVRIVAVEGFIVIAIIGLGWRQLRRA